MRFYSYNILCYIYTFEVDYITMEGKGGEMKKMMSVILFKELLNEKR